MSANLFCPKCGVAFPGEDFCPTHGARLRPGKAESTQGPKPGPSPADEPKDAPETKEKDKASHRPDARPEEPINGENRNVYLRQTARHLHTSEW